MSLAAFVYSVSVLANIVVHLNEPERGFLLTWISKGKTPINIRAVAIRDPLLIEAIKKGAMTRHVRIILDEVSPSLEKSVPHTMRLEVRRAPAGQRGKFNGKKLTHSFVMERAEGYYQWWSGTRVWQKEKFRSKTQFMTESDKVPWRTSPESAKKFDREFDKAEPVTLFVD
jgi:hypothetical protein